MKFRKIIIMQYYYNLYILYQLKNVGSNTIVMSEQPPFLSYSSFRKKTRIIALCTLAQDEQKDHVPIHTATENL